MTSNVYVGISGFSYSEWYKEHGFYEKIKPADALRFYSTHFNFVEINSSFYHEPSITTLLKWKNSVPEHFRFTLKVNQYFTHRKKLLVDEEFIKRWHAFIEKCLILETKLGSILFQLPPSLKFDNNANNAIKDRLKSLSKLLSHDICYVFEVRHSSWENSDVYELFQKSNWSLSGININNETQWAGDLKGGFFPQDKTLWDTAQWGGYVRFHGADGKYKGSYDKKCLQEVIAWIENHRDSNKQYFIAFNNTFEKGIPSAIKDAKQLKKLLAMD